MQHGPADLPVYLLDLASCIYFPGISSSVLWSMLYDEIVVIMIRSELLPMPIFVNVTLCVCMRLQLASIRKLYHELEGRMKGVKAAIIKLQEEVCILRKPRLYSLVIFMGATKFCIDK